MSFTISEHTHRLKLSYFPFMDERQSNFFCRIPKKLVFIEGRCQQAPHWLEGLREPEKDRLYGKTYRAKNIGQTYRANTWSKPKRQTHRVNTSSSIPFCCLPCTWLHALRRWLRASPCCSRIFRCCSCSASYSRLRVAQPPPNPPKKERKWCVWSDSTPLGRCWWKLSNIFLGLLWW